MKTNFLVVSGIESIHSDALNVDFKKVTFVAKSMIGNKTFANFGAAAAGVRNLWPERTLQLKAGGTSLAKADNGFDEVTLGLEVEGKIESFITNKPYTIPGSTNSTRSYKVVVFNGENGLALAAKNLAQYGVVPLDPETGEIYNPSGIVVKQTADVEL